MHKKGKKEGKKRDQSISQEIMSAKSFFRFCRALRRRLRPPLSWGGAAKYPRCSSGLDRVAAAAPSSTVAFELEGALLRSTSAFPYFMLAALEVDGGLLRAAALLLAYPVMLLLGRAAALRAMVMLTFCGVRAGAYRGGRAVLPKHFLEDVSAEVFDAVSAGRRRVCVTAMPRVMVEAFLTEWVGVDAVAAGELVEWRGRYVGLLARFPGSRDARDFAGEDDVVAVAASPRSSLELFAGCKEVYVPTDGDRGRWAALPRERYRKPLVFHDGRLAFRPTPPAALAMFTWLPFAAFLAVARALIFCLLPFSLSVPILASLGMHSRLVDPAPSPAADGIVYVCNHRTLLDPLYISGAVKRWLTATTYSISPLTELISPVKTVRLTRDRVADERTIRSLLDEGHAVVVCPEGTTCREPYLLRFSPLFAELRRVIVPVAIVTKVSMFYGTSTGGRKYFDPLYHLMNPVPSIWVQLLPAVDVARELAREDRSSRDIANELQRKIGEALGFACTTLTRKDKYQSLVGTDGTVAPGNGKK